MWGCDRPRSCQVDHRHQCEGAENTGDDTAQKQLSDGDIGDHPVKHHGDRGRHQRTDQRGRGRDRAGEIVVIAGLAHGLGLGQ